MDKETSDQIQELIQMLSDTQAEVMALREVMIDRKLTTADELILSQQAIVHERYHELKAELMRRKALDRIVKDPLKP